LIIILGAMDGEISAFRSAIAEGDCQTAVSAAGSDVLIGTLEGRAVALARAGVGKAMSALSAQSVIELLARRGTPAGTLLFTGLAGAVNPDYEIGDTVFSRDCVQHDLDATALGITRGAVPYTGYRFLEADPGLLEAAAEYRPEAGTPRFGRVLTGDQFISRRDDPDHAYLLDELSGDAVEMEGASVALCAAVNRIPFLLIRTISDRADGSAAVKFNEFLPIASENSLRAVRHLLSRWKVGTTV
jgi:5'-methylthioadenosine/S-adenosylhomocysteine nucleosidase